MTHQVRWGILGCARIARLQVIPAILRCANARLQAMASRDSAKLNECRALFGDFTAHSSYDALLADPDVDAIYLPLPNSLHCEWAIKAMRAGKHVLCEKPLALKAADVEAMIAVARECGVLLMEAFMYRYTDRVRKIQAVLDSGALGQVRSINSTFRFFLDRENTIKEEAGLGGGALYDVGCYPLNLIGMITQDEPESVGVACDLANGVDTNFSAVLRYRSGLIASLHCGFNAFGRMHTEITGTRGVLLAPDTFLDNAGQLQLITDKGTETIEVAASDRYASEVEDFSAAVLKNSEILLDLTESLRNAKTIERLANQRFI